MKKLLGYLPFHFLCCLIVGICIQFYTDFWKLNTSIIYGVFSVLSFLMIVLRKKSVFIFLVWVAFFFVGVSIVYCNDTRNNENYFEKYLSKESHSILQIKKVLKPGSFDQKYEVEVIQINEKNTIGKALLNVQKDSTSQLLKVDDQIFVSADFVEVKKPLNPYQFSYREYLKRQGIYKQIYVRPNELHKLKSTTSFLGSIAKIRLSIQKSLKKEGFSEDEFAVMNALLLGQRQGISKELLNEYSRAGAIHILAVSGLHVGIILLILSWLFSRLERLKNGKVIKSILIVLFLWFFALLAGMSASVVRAVTMFSAIAIGMMVNQKNSIEQSLVFSMFLLLLCKPMFLFDVGFQLSYLAVFGIITIQPKLSVLWKPKYKLTNKIWQLTTVSLAAQLSVLPLSLYYFHQFPGLFLLSNLVIIPFLGTILIGGILIILLSVTSLLPGLFVTIYESIIGLMNSFIEFVSNQEEFLFSDIPFSLLKMITCYIMIVFGVQFFTEMRAKRLLLFLSSIIILQSAFLYEKYEKSSKKELIVFHKSRKPIIGIRNGNKLNIAYSDSLDIMNDYAIKSYRLAEDLLVSNKEKFNYLQFKNQEILIIDELGIYDINNIQSPIVFLTGSSKVNLERLIAKLKPKQIIADGSNYKNLIEQWKETCKKTKTPFWSTYQNGAYILR